MSKPEDVIAALREEVRKVNGLTLMKDWAEFDAQRAAGGIAEGKNPASISGRTGNEMPDTLSAVKTARALEEDPRVPDEMARTWAKAATETVGARERLADEAKSLADHMSTLHERVTSAVGNAPGSGHLVNELGEVQGRGQSLDQRATSYAAAQSHQGEIERMIANHVASNA